MTDSHQPSDSADAVALETTADDAARLRERKLRILRERAEALARRPDDVEIEDIRELVTLELGGRTYGIESEVVREVLAVREVAVLPASPPFVLGLINVRGKITAVVDLRLVLGHEGVSGSSGQVVIVEIAGVEVAIDMRECGVARVPSGRFGASDDAQSYVKSVTSDGVAVLDMERIIGDTRQSAASLASGAQA